MTQQEKQLLLIVFCEMLQYGVQYKDAHGYKKTLDIWSPEFHTALNTILYDGKPSLYLRPMSSMTEEEAEEYNDLVNELSNYDCQPEQSASKMIDWLNKHNFDYRGLIKLGLAIEAPKDMYKINN